MFVILSIATGERAAGGFAAPAIGLTVGFCALMGGPITGASMNPAGSFGPAIGGGPWRGHWIYWLAPISGMIAAAWTYEHLRQSEPSRAELRASPLGAQEPISEGKL